jgi:hypothetical protein
MRRRKLLGAVAVGLLALVAAGAFVLRPQPERITRENGARIRLGMNINQVRGILGPPGDHSTGPVIADGSPKAALGFRRFSSNSSNRSDVWVSDSAQVRVKWDDDTSFLVVYTPMTRVPQPFLDNLLWRAKRQWRKWFPE